MVYFRGMVKRGQEKHAASMDTYTSSVWEEIFGFPHLKGH